MNLHEILHEARKFLQGNYWGDSEGSSYGSRWLAASSRQQATHASHLQFFGKTSNHPGDSDPLLSWFGTLQLLAFPNTKITFEREEISDHWWDSGKYHRAADGDWENCVRSQGAHFEGDWGIIVLCKMFLVSCIFFNKCLYLSYYMAVYLLDRPCIIQKKFCLHIKWFLLC